MRPTKEGSILDKRNFTVGKFVEICPVSMMAENPEVRELIELHARHEAAKTPMFSSKLPSWALDFRQLTASVDAQIESESKLMIARL